MFHFQFNLFILILLISIFEETFYSGYENVYEENIYTRRVDICRIYAVLCWVKFRKLAVKK